MINCRICNGTGILGDAAPCAVCNVIFDAVDVYWSLVEDHEYGVLSAYDQFVDLKKKWNEETQLMSSSTDIAMNIHYQRIIGIGKDIVPVLLQDLADNPDNPSHWFWALYVHTGAVPHPPEDNGRIKKMSEAWIQWGKDHNFYPCQHLIDHISFRKEHPKS